MSRKLLIMLLFAATATCAPGCSTILYRAGQPPLIGEPHRGTPADTVLANREGQLFRIPRTSIADVRFGGVRTILWSLLTADAFVILGPIGAIQWAVEVETFNRVDGEYQSLMDVVDEEEVDPRGAYLR